MYEIKVLAILSILVNCFWQSNSLQLPPQQPFAQYPTDNYCSSTCPSNEGPEPTIIRYKDNEIYRYRVEALSSIHTLNTLKEEHTKLTYSAFFDIAPENKCSFLLRVSNVEVIGLDGKKYTDSSLAGSVARFSFNNGKLEKLCLDAKESEISVNFKRSILSNLQISSWGNPITGPGVGTSFHETDIYGRCPVSLETTQEPNGSWLVRKSKDLNQCKLRQGFDFAIKTNTFQTDGSYQTNPFVDASLRSVLKVDKGIIKSSDINEEYTYQPMTKYADSQTSVVVTTKVVLIGSKSGKIPGPVNPKPATLLYETVKSYRSDVTMATLIKAIQEASQEEEADVVPSNAAQTFSHFVSILQEVNKNELLIAHDQVKSGAGFKNRETAMKVFWGGLLSAATPATTEAAATLLMNREMPEDRIPEFMASLAFVKHPTVETLNILSPLLDEPNAAVDRYLAIGSLIQRYTFDNPHTESPELTNLLAKLSTPLKKRSNSQAIEEQDVVIASLKGLRNARHLSSDVSSLVRSYATNKDVPNRVRIAALQTLAVNSSDEATKKTALEIFQSKEEDSELRIGAFLLYVNSPNAETAIAVKNLLDEELSDQVGSFIVSWIRNLKTTADPKREHAKHFYGNIKSKNKFPVDIRQFSQNYHFSHLFPSLNSGYSADANVIYSSTSYIPRTTSLNLDTNLFGNSVNLFGLNARLENVEYFLEKMLGPRSYLRSNKAEDIADDLTEMAKNLGRKMASKTSFLGRGKREIHNMEETVSQLKQKISPSEKYMDVDFSINMFESEFYWTKYHTDKNVVASGEYLDHLLTRIQQAIENAKDMNINYKKYSRIPILSNNVVYYPTSSGFPLKVSINAHSAVDFKLKGKVDTAEILNNPKSSDVQLLIMPSAVVEIEGLLEIDTYILSAGLKVSSTLRSATSLKINFKALDGNGVDLKFGLPTKEEDLLTMKTEAFTTTRERGLSPVETPLNSDGKRYQYENTFRQLADLTGLALRTEFNIPSVGYRPTAGTGVFSVRLIKTDELLQDYQMKIFYNKNMPHYRSIEFLLDTPGSQINRKIMFFADANSKEKKASLKLAAGKKEFSLDAHGENENNEVYCLIKLRNDASEQSAKVGATVTKEQYRTTYKPFLELKSPVDAREAALETHRLTPKDNSQPFTLDGLVVLEEKPNSNTYRLYNFKNLAFISPFGKFVLNGRVLLESEYPRYGSDLVLTYGNENTLKLKSAWNYTKNLEEDKQLLAAIAATSSQWPLYNIKSTLNYNRNTTSYARTMTLTTGPDLENENAKLTVREVLNKKQNPNTGEIISADGNFGFIYPSWKTDIDLSFQRTYNKFSGSGVMQLDKTHLELNGSVGVEETKPGLIEVNLETQMNEKHLHLHGVRELVDEETSKITVDLNTKPGKQLHMVMDLTHRLKPHHYVLRSNSVVTVLPDNRVYKQDLGLTHTPTQKKFHVILSPNGVRNLEISAGCSSSSSDFDSKAVLFVLNSLEGTAALKSGPERVDGDLRLEILKLNRLITGDLELQVHDRTHYTGHGELLWDASKDKSKKIRVETNTLISEDHHEIISENDVQMMNYRFQLNGNISIEGDLLNSTVDSHIQLVVSNGSSMGVLVHREYRGQEAVHNYNLHLDGYYIPLDVNDQVEGTFTFNIQDLDWSNYLFDVRTDWTLDLAKSKSLKHGIEIKRILHDSQWAVGANLYVDGTIALKKLNLSAEAEYSDMVNDYGLLSKERSLPPSTLRLHANVGDEYMVDSAAAIHNSEISNVLELKLPLQNKSFDLKWTTKNKVDIAPAKYVNLRTTNNVSWNKNNFANWNGELAVFSKKGNFSLDWDSSEIAKRSMEVSYIFDDSQEGNLTGPYGQVGIILTFDGKEANCIGKLEFSKDLSTKVLTIDGQSPKHGLFKIRAETRVEDFGQKIFQDLLFESNGKRWYTYSDIATYPSKPMVDLLYSSPEAESKFMILFEERIRHYWTGAINVSLMHGIAGYVKLVGELKLNTQDDILIKADLDAPSFGVNNFSLVANNKAMEGGKKRISFTAQMDQEALFTGSSSYMYHMDSNKLTFEGAGTVKIDDKNHPFTFKYYKVQLLESTSGETGSASKLYVSVDNKKYALDLECKFTDKSVMLKRDLWRDENCYKMDISYQIKMIDVTNYEKNLIIHLDLKPHISNGELFVIEGKTTRTLSNYDQKLSLQWAPEKKIEYVINSTPGKSGITINLPKRQLAAEAVYIYDLGATNGKVKMTNTIWFDKTRDDTKKLLFSSDIEYRIPENQNSFVLRSSADLHIPTLPKTLSASTTMVLSLLEEKSMDLRTELDVFKTPEQMITVSYELFKGRKDNGYMVWSSLKAISEGQKMNSELKRSLTFYLDHMEYHLSLAYDNDKGVRKIAAVDLEFRPLSLKGKISYDNFTLEGKSELGFTRNSIELKEHFILFGHDYKKTCTLKLDPSIVVLIQWKGASQQAAMLNATFLWNQALDVTFSLRDKNDVAKSKGDITRFKLFLTDKRFLNTETEFLIDQARIFLDDGKQELLSLIEDAKKRSKSAMNEIDAHYTYRSKQYRNANLDMKPVITSSNAYLVALRDEIKNDPSIVSASQNVRKIISSFVDFVFVILEQTSSFLGDWFYGYDILSEKLSEFFEEVVTLINKVSQLSMDDVSLLMRDALNQFWRQAIRFFEYAKANKTKWKDAVISVSNSVKDTFKVASETFAQVRKDFQEFYERLKAYLESLPLTNYLKGRFAQLKDSQVVKYLWSAVREAGENLKEYMPNEESKTLINMILSTMDKIVNEKPYNLENELRAIYKQLLECLSLLAVKAADGFMYVRDVSDSYDYSLPQLSLSSFKALPNLWTSSVSFIYWLREIEVPSVNDLLETFDVGSLNSLELLPPFTKIGLIVDGQQVVTMNGLHYSINADCHYLLAADFINLNFTIIATVRNGKMSSLSVTSDKQTVELNSNGMPALNKVRQDYPIYADKLSVIRNPTSVEIFVDNSVYIYSSLSLDIVMVQVSGFFYGQVFGLMGSTTSESYLDLTMPNMSVARDLPTFIKSYQVSKKCRAPTPATNNELRQSSECTSIFGGKSLVRRGSSQIKAKAFKDMCEEMVARQSTSAEKLNAACQAALAFSVVSYTRGYYITLPTQCSHCTMNGKSLPYGYAESVKVPNNSADVFILLDKSERNKILYQELLKNAMKDIRSSLEKKNIRDLNFVLIGFAEDQFASLQTTNGEVTLTENTNIKFSTAVSKEPSSNLGRYVKNVKHFLGIYEARRALDMVNNYPFRPEAVNSIIQVDADTHEYNVLDKYSIYNTVVNTYVSWNIVNNKMPIFLLTPKESVFIDVDNSSTAVFGFDLISIFTANGPQPFKDGILSRLKLLELYGGSVILPATTNGAVYNSSVFVNSDSAARNKLTSVFSNRLVESLINTERSVECVCKNNWGIFSDLRCTLISESPKSRNAVKL